jgi:hypothetical protein
VRKSRAEEAAQEKLNVIIEVLAELMDSGAARNDSRLRDAAERLCEAVGLEVRH